MLALMVAMPAAGMLRDRAEMLWGALEASWGREWEWMAPAQGRLAVGNKAGRIAMVKKEAVESVKRLQEARAGEVREVVAKASD